MDDPFDYGLNFWACQYIARNEEYRAESDRLQREREALIEAAKNSTAASALVREVEDEEDHLSNVEYYARKCPDDSKVSQLAERVSEYREAWSAFLGRYGIAGRVEAYRVDAEEIIKSLLDNEGLPILGDFPYPVDLKSPVIVRDWSIYFLDGETMPEICPRLVLEVDITAPGAVIMDLLRLKIQEAREQARTLGYHVQEKAGRRGDTSKEEVNVNSLERAFAAPIHRYDPRSDASRALGLWLWDRQQRTQNSATGCIEEIEFKGWPSDLRGDNKDKQVDLYTCLRKTAECIRACRVLSLH